MKTLEPSAEYASRKTGLDLLRARLMTSLAPSQAHHLRGLLNGVVLSGEVVRLSGNGKRDETAATVASETFRASTARFREAFESFLKHLIAPELEDTSCDPGQAMHDAAALITPLALRRKIVVEVSSCPAYFPIRALSRAMVTVLAFSAVEVLKDVADGGRIRFEATMYEPGPRIVVSGEPSLLHEAPSGALPEALGEAVAAFGGSQTGMVGSGFSFHVGDPAA